MRKDRFGLEINMGDIVLFPGNGILLQGEVASFGILTVCVRTTSQNLFGHYPEDLIGFNTIQSLLKSDHPELLI
jgi:hypothetical protein